MQNIIVGLIVGGCAIYIIKSLLTAFSGKEKSGGGCGCNCSGCPMMRKNSK